MMTPFSTRQYGPDWLRKPFPNPSRREEDEIHNTLFVFFNPIILWSRLNSSKTSLREAPYHPNLVNNKFGLSQLLPKCCIPIGEGFLCSTDNAIEKWLKGNHEYCKKNEFFLHDFDYTLSYHCTQKFEE